MPTSCSRVGALPSADRASGARAAGGLPFPFALSAVMEVMHFQATDHRFARTEQVRGAARTRRIDGGSHGRLWCPETIFFKLIGGLRKPPPSQERGSFVAAAERHKEGYAPNSTPRKPCH